MACVKPVWVKSLVGSHGLGALQGGGVQVCHVLLELAVGSIIPRTLEDSHATLAASNLPQAFGAEANYPPTSISLLCGIFFFSLFLNVTASSSYPIISNNLLPPQNQPTAHLRPHVYASNLPNSAENRRWAVAANRLSCHPIPP